MFTEDLTLLLLVEKLRLAGWPERNIEEFLTMPIEDLADHRFSLPSNSNVIAAIREGRIDRKPKYVGKKVEEAFQMLTEEGLLPSCIDLVQLEMIRDEGPEFYRKHFDGLEIYAWRAKRGDYVPYIKQEYGHLPISYRWIRDCLGTKDIALRIR